MIHTSSTLRAGVIVFLIAAFFASILIWILEKDRLQFKHVTVTNIATDCAHAIHENIEQSISSTYALAALVRQGNGSINNFDDFANQMLQFYPGTTLELAPNGIIKNIVPLAGNEHAIGLDLLKDPRRSNQSMLSKESERLTLAGPFNLVQGGVGAIALLPVYLDDVNGTSHFWGFTIALIHFPGVFDPTRFSQLVARGFQYELWCKQPESMQKQVITKSSAFSLTETIDVTLEVPNGKWILSVAPINGWSDPLGLSLKIVLGLIFSIMCSAIANLLVVLKKHKMNLELQIGIRTSDLKKEIAAHKHAEELVRSSEEKYRLLVDNANEAIIVVQDGMIKFVNQKAIDITGYSETEFLAKPFLDFIHSDDRRMIIEYYKKRMKEGLAPSRYTFRIFTNNGTVLWVELNTAVVKWKSKPATLNLLTDITERKLAEDALRESEAEFRVLSENSLTGIYIIQNGFLDYTNPALEKIFGYESGELHGVSALVVVHPEDHDLVTKTLESRLAGEVQSRPKEWRGKCKNGKVINIESVSQKIKWKNVPAVMGNLQDITERKRAEEALRESEERYRSIISVSNTGAWEYHSDKEFLWCSPEYFTMLGRNRADFDMSGNTNLKETWIDLLHPDDREADMKCFADYLKNGSIGTYENYFRMQHRDESWIWIWSRGQTLRDVNGVLTNLTVGTHINITERKRAEKDLIEAKEKAEEMNRVKNYFLSNMSHELRTPLISVLGFAELLQQELSEPEHLEFTNHILEGGKRLNYTLTSILELSKLESTQSFLELKPLNLAGEIETSVKSFLPMAQSKKLFLNTDLKDIYLHAHIDSELFSKTLYHLVNNAVKFTKQGGVIVSLNHERKQENDWAVIKVIDTGVGIPSEEINKIFAAFRQSSEGHSRSHEGTGLGLTIAKRTVELMKGSIQVESEVGKGSVFSVWLPAVLDQNQIETKVEELRKTTVIEPPTPKEKGMQKVLIVDDNSSNRLFMNHCLSKHMRVVEAEDGLSSVSFSSQEHFDLVLMDINLGAGIDGVEAMHQIRRIPSYTRVPIIAVTAYVMPGDKERFLNEGFDSYLGKPFTKEVLVNLVETSLTNVRKMNN